MPIYMDVHVVPGVKAHDVAEAHRLDQLIADEHHCKCMTYWIDEQRETVFCLIEAPRKEAVSEMHAAAHGLVPSKIIEVNSSIVESFLGRILDPADAEITSDGLKVFTSPSFRTIMITTITDPVLLENKSGVDVTSKILEAHKNIVRKNLSKHGGREVEHEGNGFIVSFPSASSAVACAIEVNTEMSRTEHASQIEFSVAVCAGEPVEQSESLFGDAINLGRYLCAITENFQVAVSSAVYDLVHKDHGLHKDGKLVKLSPQDESFLQIIFNTLEANWQDPEFDMTEYCQAATMSKSQLYRKTVEFTNLSPNLLLKEFRLEKARQMMKKRRYSISQITFDSGFTSPSYFTKCFKKKYGLLPMEYIDKLH